MAIARALFAGHHRHVTADEVFEEVRASGHSLSLATVYNALAQFVCAGLVRRIVIGGERSYFDTDTGDHHHFFVEAENRVIDVDSESIRVAETPPAPPGYRIIGVDVVVRLQPLEPGHA